MLVQFAPHQKESMPNFIYALSTLMPGSIPHLMNSIKYFYDNKGKNINLHRKKSVQSTYDGYHTEEITFVK